MASKLETIILKASEWLRGDGDSYLLRNDGKMCCLGIAAKHFGATDESIEACPGLSDMRDGHIPDGLRFLMDADDSREDGPLTSGLYRANDRLELTPDKERCASLNEVLADAKAPFRFKFVATK